ncbi:helix-turn-helix domain-containing protein [Streptomyces sp. NPDC051452]|uniref:helix-turn-helix domain-containing protein n=1 Tax=Streptomyces sp. NPDC051452 TaxID=3365654 RepID=UPI0037A878A5
MIPLRPGLAEPPKPPPSEPLDVARRRIEALRLSRESLSLREIGDRLGVSKDTVRRDIAAAEREEAEAAEETARDTGETSDGSDETPPAPGDGDRDTLVLVLDEPLRQALTVLRGVRGAADDPKQNVAVARAAIRSLADHFEDQRNRGGRTS